MQSANPYADNHSGSAHYHTYTCPNICSPYPHAYAQGNVDSAYSYAHSYPDGNTHSAYPYPHACSSYAYPHANARSSYAHAYAHANAHSA